MSDSNILITITGPSTTGKSKLASLLKPYGFDELVSTTTRPRRQGEIDGVHYNFVDVPKFQDMLNNNLMIEQVKVGENFYGVSKPAFDYVISQGKNGVAVVEPRGAKQVALYCAKNNINLHQVFINNPLEILMARLFTRFKEDSLADVKTYTTRALSMVDYEQKEWVAKAYNGEDHYDQLFDSFTPENENEVSKKILEAIDLKLTKKNSNKRKIS